MLPKQDIDRYGGKAAVLNHISEKTSLPIPVYVVKEAGASVDSVLDAFGSMRKPVIVRSSSPYEYGDFEGIFESVRDVHDERGLGMAVERVERSAVSERARKYAKQHGFEISGRIHVMIQEQSDSTYCGAMMRHPNNPDLVFMSYFSGRGDYSQDYSHFLFDERTKSKANDTMATYSNGITEETARFLVEQYKKIEELKEIGDGRSLFVEFGFQPFAVYQARPFKKIETVDFELPADDLEEKDSLRSDFVFGITPPEGVVMPVVRSFGVRDVGIIGLKIYDRFGGTPQESNMRFREHDEVLEMHFSNIVLTGAMAGGIDEEGLTQRVIENWNLENDALLHEKPYCLMTSSAQRDKYDVDLSVPNMRTLVIGGVENFLVHNLMRLFKQSNVTVGLARLHNRDFFKDTTSLDDKVRITSNGKEAVVQRA